jgi:GT2 family glycosyltransferase
MTAEPVSLISTVRDEASSIDAFLGALLAQTRPPDEIVIVDGGSSDGTVERIRRLGERAELPVHLIEAPGTTISAGRNLAIEAARGPIVAVTDAGTVADGDWLESIVAPLAADPELAVVGGFFRPGGGTLLERVLSVVITPQLPEVEPEAFLPSSRSIAFRRPWWERVGGYPEWLRHGEDLVFDLELRRAGGRFAFAPGARVTWTARSSLRAYARQYFNYARAEGHAGLFPLRHVVRYSAYLTGLALLIATLAAEPLAAIAIAVGAAVYLSKFYRRVARIPPAGGIAARLAAWTLVPVIVVTGDLAKMVGYPVGRFERLAKPEIAAGWRRYRARGA